MITLDLEHPPTTSDVGGISTNISTTLYDDTLLQVIYASDFLRILGQSQTGW